MNTTINTYFNIEDEMYDDFRLIMESDGNPKNIQMNVYYYSNHNHGYVYTYEISEDGVLPSIFDKDNIRDFINALEYFEFEFYIVHKLPKHISMPSECYKWKLVQKYDFTMHGSITVTLHQERTV